MAIEKSNLSSPRTRILLGILGIVVIVALYLLYDNYLKVPEITTAPQAPISLPAAVQETQQEINYEKEMDNLREDLLNNKQFMELDKFADDLPEKEKINKDKIFPKREIQ